MSDASTNQPLPADVGKIAAGRGRHRGKVSTQESDTAPRGRHRKSAEEQTETAA